MTTGMSAVVETRPGELVDLLTADFQRRAEPQFAWKSLVSQFLALSGLRGFWPMSSVYYTASPRVPDASGQGNDLDDNNTVTFGYDNLIPYAGFVAASTQYLDRADGGASNWADIIGTESYIVAGDRGLTLGGWFYFNTTDVACALLSKWLVAGNERSFHLFRGALNDVVFEISVDGTAITQLAGGAIAASAWYYIVGRFTPSTEMAVFINGTKYTNIVSIPAALNDSATAFEIGRTNAASYLDGYASMCFLCATALSDAIIGQLYEQSRVAYGVLS